MTQPQPYRRLSGPAVFVMLAATFPLPSASGQDGDSRKAADSGAQTDPTGSPRKDSAPPAETAKPGEAAGKPPPPGVMATVNGRNITVEEYSSYLLARFGKSKLDEYVDRLLVDEAAKKQGIEIEPKDVEAALEERIQRTIESLYQGDRERFVAKLHERRSTLEDKRALWRQQIYYDMLIRRLILKERKVTDKLIQKEFERQYGDSGVSYSIRHILVSKRLRGPGGFLRSDAEAKKEAEKILASLKGGAKFTDLVKEHSDDLFTKGNGGLIPNYRRTHYGDTFHAAVEKLKTKGATSEVVASPRGYHIIQLVERKETKLADVRKEVEESLRQRAPTVEEKLRLFRSLREKASIQGLD